MQILLRGESYGIPHNSAAEIAIQGRAHSANTNHVYDDSQS